MNIFNSNSLTSLNFCHTNFPHCAEMNFNQLPLHPIKNEYQLNCSTIRQHPQILKKSYRTRKNRVGSFHYNEKKCKLTNLLELSFLDVFAFPKASSIKFVKRTSFSEIVVWKNKDEDEMVEWKNHSFQREQHTKDVKVLWYS